MICLLDRIVDVRLCRDWKNTTDRMRFGKRYHSVFVACIFLCGAGLTAALIVGINPGVLRRGAVVAGGMVVYFLLFVLPTSVGKFPGKEFLVGVFFALGAYVALGWGDGFAQYYYAAGEVGKFGGFPGGGSSGEGEGEQGDGCVAGTGDVEHLLCAGGDAVGPGTLPLHERHAVVAQGNQEGLRAPFLKQAAGQRP